MILHFVDDYLLALLQLNTRSRVVGIFIWHHVEQLHCTMRSSRDGERNVNSLAIGIRSSGIGRDILVINIYRTLDEPVVGRNSIAAFILTADVVAVVDNRLRTVYKVSRCLPFHVGTCICEVASCDSTIVQFRQSVMLVLGICSCLVHVLSIYEAPTHTWLYVDEVEFYNTSDVAPVFLIQTVARTLFGGQLEIYTRCQRHLILTGTVVALTVIDEACLPVVVGRCTVCFRFDRSATVVVCLGCSLEVRIGSIVCNTHIL